MKVIILCGISGSGKSTLAGKPGDRVKFVVSADDYFMRDGGYYDFDPALLGEAHADCLRRFVRAIQPGVCSEPTPTRVVVDNTNTTVAELAPYAALALAYGYELEIVILHCEPSVALQRNVHNVPERTIMGQYCRLLKLRDSLPPWWPVTEEQAI